MIRSRSYAVPLTAVLLALATGIALGAGPLTDTRSSASTDPGLGRGRPSPATPTRSPPRWRAGSTTTGCPGARSRLVTLPGADPATVAALATQVKAAGGQLAGTYAVQRQLVDAQQKNLVDTLGSQLARQLKGKTDPTGLDLPPHRRAGGARRGQPWLRRCACRVRRGRGTPEPDGGQAAHAAVGQPADRTTAAGRARGHRSTRRSPTACSPAWRPAREVLSRSHPRRTPPWPAWPPTA